MPAVPSPKQRSSLLKPFPVGRGEIPNRAPTVPGAHRLAHCTLGCRSILSTGRGRTPPLRRNESWPNGSTNAGQCMQVARWMRHKLTPLRKSRDGPGQSACLPDRHQILRLHRNGAACAGSKPRRSRQAHNAELLATGRAAPRLARTASGWERLLTAPATLGQLACYANHARRWSPWTIGPTTW